MSLVVDGCASCILLGDFEFVASLLANTFEVLNALVLQFDQRHIHVRCNLPHRDAVVDLVGVDFAIRLEILSSDWSNQDGLNARGARLGHILPKVLFVIPGICQRPVSAERCTVRSDPTRCRSGGRRWPVEHKIVVPELDQHIVRLGLERPLPQALRTERACARPAFGHVHAVDIVRKVGAKTAPIPRVVGLCRIPNQIDAQCGPRLAHRRGCRIE